MVPQTKHLVVVIALLALASIVTVSSLHVKEGKASISFMLPQTALVSEAIPKQPEVVVIRDTTREDTRASLKERLRAFVNDAAAPSDPSPAASDPAPEEVAPKEKVARCDPRVAVKERNNWGPVNITVTEGARVVTSLAIDDAGFPLHRLELPLLPRIGEPSCLPSDMVGILIDGTVVLSDTPVRSDAEGLAGYALDGFSLFGRFEDGRTLTSGDLDECHGHVHAIVDQGILTSMYHYHLTDDAPFSLGCFRGIPVSQ